MCHGEELLTIPALGKSHFSVASRIFIKNNYILYHHFWSYIKLWSRAMGTKCEDKDQVDPSSTFVELFRHAFWQTREQGVSLLVEVLVPREGGCDSRAGPWLPCWIPRRPPPPTMQHSSYEDCWEKAFLSCAHLFTNHAVSKSQLPVALAIRPNFVCVHHWQGSSHDYYTDNQLVALDYESFFPFLGVTILTNLTWLNLTSFVGQKVSLKQPAMARDRSCWD